MLKEYGKRKEKDMEKSKRKILFNGQKERQVYSGYCILSQIIDQPPCRARGLNLIIHLKYNILLNYSLLECLIKAEVFLIESSASFSIRLKSSAQEGTS